ncbi:flagellar basal body L-ring protein FlgH [Aquabacterium sp. A08]|uniref:flagellar basal body L-ring protein FlgH n=1 Tax=Aquabacterium sp. A08 TaxID=2718532 RepID=UPI00141DC094|nr:flagellar basal body L-ring protein FlgH [Aquabacterium sp. A08]NIC40213.1 flagellar basal body L-ring protein FlgH [Aquabacterium sp. A08]
MNIPAPRSARRRRAGAWCLLGLVAVAASGCASLSQIPDVDLAKAPEKLDYPQARAAAPEPVNGSLFSAASYRPGFEDHRARLVGDTLTVQIAERLSATQQSSSSVNRESELSAGVSTFPFLNQNLLGKLNAGAESSNTFNGDGSTQASNTFTGNITAVVTEVLPNGHLRVVGEKQIGVNQNVDVLQFSGTVDPRTIRPGNTVPSTQVADVRVLSRGRGAQADAQTFGWLSRFFLTLLPF